MELVLCHTNVRTVFFVCAFILLLLIFFSFLYISFHFVCALHFFAWILISISMLSSSALQMTWPRLFAMRLFPLASVSGMAILSLYILYMYIFFSFLQFGWKILYSFLYNSNTEQWYVTVHFCFFLYIFHFSDLLYYGCFARMNFFKDRKRQFYFQCEIFNGYCKCILKWLVFFFRKN